MDGLSYCIHVSLQPSRIKLNVIESNLTLAFIFSCYFIITGFAPVATRSTSTALSARIPEDDRTADQVEIYKIGEKWSEVRMLSREEADKLEPEWLEAYNRYFAKYDEDMAIKMAVVATKIQKMIEPPKRQPKTDGQRRRDKYAKLLARQEARREEINTVVSQGLLFAYLL
jgi:hypothetical protein